MSAFIFPISSEWRMYWVALRLLGRVFVCTYTFMTCFMIQPASRCTYCQSKARYSWNIFQKVSPHKPQRNPVVAKCGSSLASNSGEKIHRNLSTQVETITCPNNDLFSLQCRRALPASSARTGTSTRPGPSPASTRRTSPCGSSARSSGVSQRHPRICKDSFMNHDVHMKWFQVAPCP